LSGQQETARNAANTEAGDLRAVNETDHVWGNSNASVTIVEFSDIECPFCKKFHQTMIQIMNEYGRDGRVAWVYRHFPLEQSHQFAREGALAAECANEEGGPEAFWSFVNEVFGSSQPVNSDLFNRWASYLLEAIESEIGFSALEDINKILSDRLNTNRW